MENKEPEEELEEKLRSRECCQEAVKEFANEFYKRYIEGNVGNFASPEGILDQLLKEKGIE